MQPSFHDDLWTLCMSLHLLLNRRIYVDLIGIYYLNQALATLAITAQTLSQYTKRINVDLLSINKYLFA